MKRFILLFFALLSFSAFADKYPTGWVPDVSNTIVVDLADLLSQEQLQTLEHRLVAFDDTTSNQIAILITPSLGGDEIAHFSQEVFAKWKIGHKEDNGVLIVLKPKTAFTDGEVRIHTGYGLEGALPDAFCSNIIENDMIPHFRDDDYYGGIVAALNVIEKVCEGEYSYEIRKEEEAREARIAAIVFFVMFGIVVVVVLLVSADQKKHPERYKSLTSQAAGTIIGSSLGRSSGSWNSFSSGSGGFGGFGGFGGGFSGGGGASGRW